MYLAYGASELSDNIVELLCLKLWNLIKGMVI